MKMRNTTPLRKAQKIWREFPFLWGITQSWGSVQTVRVQRLDSEALLAVLNPEEHTVFLHVVAHYRDNSLWDDFLEKLHLDKKAALVDVVFSEGRTAFREIKEIIVVERLRPIRDSDGKQILNFWCRDRFFTIYKPPHRGSISELVQQEWAKLERTRTLPSGSGSG